MIDKICANFGCCKPAYKLILVGSGRKQYRCKVCYERRVEARRKVG